MQDERPQKSMDSLRQALDDFHPPVAIFRERGGDLLPEEDPSMEEEEDDVAGKMQRIRARFKLLMVQLGLPRFSLKRVMDEAAAAGGPAPSTNGQSARPSEPIQETPDW